jgi:hypothetical protein
MHDAAAADARQAADRDLRREHRRGIGRAGERPGLAHEGAQVGVLPVLDAAVRQAARLEAREAVDAQALEGGARRAGVAQGAEGADQRLFGRGPDGGDSVHGHAHAALPTMSA